MLLKYFNYYTILIILVFVPYFSVFFAEVYLNIDKKLYYWKHKKCRDFKDSGEDNPRPGVYSVVVNTQQQK